MEENTLVLVSLCKTHVSRILVEFTNTQTKEKRHNAWKQERLEKEYLASPASIIERESCPEGKKEMGMVVKFTNKRI